MKSYEEFSRFLKALREAAGGAITAQGKIDQVVQVLADRPEVEAALRRAVEERRSEAPGTGPTLPSGVPAGVASGA